MPYQLLHNIYHSCAYLAQCCANGNNLEQWLNNRAYAEQIQTARNVQEDEYSTFDIQSEMGKIFAIQAVRGTPFTEPEMIDKLLVSMELAGLPE